LARNCIIENSILVQRTAATTSIHPSPVRISLSGSAYPYAIRTKQVENGALKAKL
jgi:hypothetical protein